MRGHGRHVDGCRLWHCGCHPLRFGGLEARRRWLKGYVYWGSYIFGGTIRPNYDTVTTSLGKRLGNCTANTKIPTINVNRGAGVNVVFNADYTNTTIYCMINAALGASAMASEYALSERYRPHFNWSYDE